MRASWVLDDRGDIWPEASRNLALALDTRRSGDDLTHFLIGQMGFVVIRERGAWTEVKFDPATVSPVALTSIFYWGQNRKFLPTSCTQPSDNRIALVFTKQIEFHKHIGKLIEARTPRPDYEAMPINLGLSTFQSTWSTVAALYDTDTSTLDRLDELDRLLNGHFLIAERQDNGDYALKHAGGLAQTFDPRFCDTSVLRSFRDATDRKYGAWSADRFKSIRNGDAPVIESVVAVAEFHARPRQRYFYQRLMMPLKSSTRRDQLLVTVGDVTTAPLVYHAV